MIEIVGGDDSEFTKELVYGTDVPKGTFELGLVLGGTVSAGAYTAGVMDFFFEALDAWQAAKDAGDPSIPDWNVVIKAIAGTSGGGVTAALLGRALSWKFPHVRAHTGESVCTDNPLYRVWVNELDVKGMLEVDDLKKVDGLKFSILNPGPLDKASDLIVQYEASFPKHAPATHRTYLGERLPLLLTLTNLRGIPYKIDMGGGLKQDYLQHADHVRISVFTNGGNGALRPDEFGIGAQVQGPGALDWARYAQFALGTAAFPFGFPSRELSRPAKHYNYRAVVLPAGPDTPPKVVFKKVDWAQAGITDSASATYDFLAVDGGVTDNEPIQLARHAISGLVRGNRRNGQQADRAILLVDPFAEPPLPGPTKHVSLTAEGAALISSWKEQARYDTCDLLLANDEECYSRFMITAKRQYAEQGGKSIATASVSAFGGFLCKDFRRHDFFLGRANCQWYLRNKLVLPIGNPLFDTWRQKASAQQLARWTVMDNGAPALPIIPLLGACDTEEETLDYPRNTFNPEDDAFQRELTARLGRVLSLLTDEVGPDGIPGLLADVYLGIGKLFGKPQLAQRVTSAISDSLERWDLA